MGGTLARRLQDATDPASAAEALAEALLEETPAVAARVWLLQPGDRCGTCLNARGCPVDERDRCLHLAAGLGEFTSPVVAAERWPRSTDLAEAAAGCVGHVTTWPLLAGAQTLGTVALRTQTTLEGAARDHIEAAISLGAATVRHLLLAEREDRRRGRATLLREVARHVTTLLDEEVLLRQVSADVRRTFHASKVEIHRDPLCIEVDGRRPEEHEPGARAILDAVAGQLAVALENAKRLATVREHEQRYRTLAETSPNAVFHLDAEGGILYLNAAAMALTGWSVGGERLADLVRDADRPDYERALSDARAGRTREGVRFRLHRADGTPRWVDAFFRRLDDVDGEASGILALVRDLSREKELQEKLYQAEKLGAIGGLVSGVAHELNNPLAGILGYAQLLLSGPREAWTRDDLEKIEHNARRCQNIVSSLLQFSRQSRLEKQPANLNEVIESVLKLNAFALRRDGVEVEKSYDARMPLMDLDPNRWQQVVINLAANAQQAILASNAREKRIRFETRVQPGEVLLTVEDTGPGVPAPVRARLFEPFFTTKDTGTGLGLSICYGIVREHGGTIELDPDHEGGTRFRIRLPLQRGSREPTGRTEAPAAVETEAPGGHILVVDDEPTIREVLDAWFTRCGFEVETCESGEEALARIAASRPDAIVADVGLRDGSSGFVLHDRLESTDPDLARRVLFVTGDASGDALQAELARRGAACLHKPFDLNELLQEVRRIAVERVGR